jgi:O-antigen/teichoic acid export membrane protein
VAAAPSGSAPAAPTTPEEPQRAAPSLRTKAIHGTAWMIAGSIGTQGISFVSNLLLAWLLSPVAFGLMATVKVVIQGLRMFSDVGIGPSIVQHKRGEEPAFLNTAWTIQAIRGVGLWLGTCVLAVPAARFYGQPELAYLLPVCGLTAVVAGLNSPALFSLNRRLDLRTLTLMNLGVQFVATVAMTILAWLTGSVWALVGGWFVTALATLVMSHTVVKQHRVWFAWDRAAAHDLFKFGRWIFLSTMVTFLAGQLDRLMLPRLLPEESAAATFGVYALSYSMVLMLTGIASELSGRVMHPVLAEHARRDPAAMEGKVLRARRLILTLAAFAVVSVVMGAPVLFGHLYPDAYGPAAWMAQLLALPVWFSILQISADRAALVMGDSRALAISNIAKLAMTCAAAVGGYMIAGVGGFIGGMALGTLAGHIVIQSSLARHGIGIVRQDVGCTAVAVGVGALGGLVPRAATGAWSDAPPLVWLLGAAVPVLGGLGVWALLRVRSELWRR